MNEILSNVIVLVAGLLLVYALYVFRCCHKNRAEFCEEVLEDLRKRPHPRRLVFGNHQLSVYDHDGTLVLISLLGSGNVVSRAIWVSEPVPRKKAQASCSYWSRNKEVVRTGRSAWSCPLCGEDVSLEYILLMESNSDEVELEFDYVKPLYETTEEAEKEN